MNIPPESTIVSQFLLTNPGTAVLVDADLLPNAVLVRNGAIDAGVVVTIAHVGTGQYSFSFTLPSAYNNGDIIKILVMATISSVAYSGFVFEASIYPTGTIFPSGANEITFTVKNSVTTLPIDGATVWISTDLIGTNVIWSGSTDAFGVARNVNGEKPFLNNGTYYAWVQDSGYTDANPTTLNVSS